MRTPEALTEEKVRQSSHTAVSRVSNDPRGMLLAPVGVDDLSSALEESVAVSPTSAIDPETGIPDLVRRLTDDSKRLASDELRLAKLEIHESVHTGARGAMWTVLALAVAVLALVALTVLLVSVSPLVGSNYWAGALIVGIVEVVVGWILLRRGLAAVKVREMTLPQSRASLADTATWVRHPSSR